MNNEMNNDTTATPSPTSTGPGQPVAGKSLRKGLTIGLAVGLLGGSAAGFAFGVPGLSSAASPSVVQQTDETDPASEPTTEAAPEVGSRLRDELQELVDAGTITAEQADAVTAHLVENGLERRGDRMERREHRGERGLGKFLGDSSEALAELLGIDAATLRQELRDGSTLAEIATANGVEVQTVIDTLVATATTQIDQAVTDGKIDAAKAEEMKATLVERVTERVNNGRPERPAHDDQAAEDTDAPVTTED